MKRYGNLFDEICSFDNLMLAFRMARKTRRKREEVMRFEFDLEHNILELQEELLNGTYRTGKYVKFFVYDPKKRLIMALPFRDRVVQWAIYQVVNPIFEARYISTSYACRVGYGAHRSIKKLQSYLRRESLETGKCFVLKLDISKYFYRVNHLVLMQELCRYLKDSRLLTLLHQIIYSKEKFGVECDDNTFDGRRIGNIGMPIGNLTSQMFANLYLNRLDHFCKFNLKVRSYIRYMDDIVIVSATKGELRKYWKICNNFVQKVLYLNLNNKSLIKTINQGFDFCGYKIWKSRISMRKKSALRMKHRLKLLRKLFKYGEIKVEDYTSSLVSYLGALKHCSYDGLKLSILKSSVLRGVVHD